MFGQLLFGAVVIISILDIYTIIRGKPSHKSALKGILNHYCFLIMWFSNVLILLGITLAQIGCKELVNKSTDINAIIAGDGLYWILEFVFWAVAIAFIWDILWSWSHKRQAQYYKWVEKIGDEGIWKYTDEEKELIKNENKKFFDTIRKILPFIKKLDKKKV